MSKERFLAVVALFGLMVVAVGIAIATVEVQLPEYVCHVAIYDPLYIPTYCEWLDFKVQSSNWPKVVFALLSAFAMLIAGVLTIVE